MTDTIYETIELNVQDLPTKYLALCEILAELASTTILEVDNAVDEYIKAGHFVVTEEALPPSKELH
jgi:hypothetical protein